MAMPGATKTPHTGARGCGSQRREDAEFVPLRVGEYYLGGLLRRIGRIKDNPAGLDATQFMRSLLSVTAPAPCRGAIR
jgi:hypothetical protein